VFLLCFIFVSLYGQLFVHIVPFCPAPFNVILSIFCTFVIEQLNDDDDDDDDDSRLITINY